MVMRSLTYIPFLAHLAFILFIKVLVDSIHISFLWVSYTVVVSFIDV